MGTEATMNKLTPNTQLWDYDDEPIFPSIGIVRHVSTHDGYTGGLVEVIPKEGEPYFQVYIQVGEHAKEVREYIEFTENDDADYIIRRFIEEMQADERDAADEMRREIAMEQGMLHGCDAYNEAMGWEVSYE
tara:strand:- start:2959 stop:3354 length:396 start_codon:yes stop_codon:yes gene_type:complete